MTVCIQCALEAFAAGKLLDEVAKASRFDEEPEAHAARVHPDLAACRVRRRELEQMAAKRLGGTLLVPEDN